VLFVPLVGLLCYSMFSVFLFFAFLVGCHSRLLCFFIINLEKGESLYYLHGLLLWVT
uniref:Uncharacterized protein n=1 Tax=Amphimedon queenslandica TaxID=400682 RepID=A0A1X7SLG9_AMPQE